MTKRRRSWESAKQGTVVLLPPFLSGVGLVFVVALLVATPAAAHCGDCNNDNEVTINEVILLVNVALEVVPLSACRDGAMGMAQPISTSW